MSLDVRTAAAGSGSPDTSYAQNNVPANKPNSPSEKIIQVASAMKPTTLTDAEKQSLPYLLKYLDEKTLKLSKIAGKLLSLGNRDEAYELAKAMAEITRPQIVEKSKVLRSIYAWEHLAGNWAKAAVIAQTIPDKEIQAQLPSTACSKFDQK